MIWSGGKVPAATYLTIADFQKATGQDAHGLELTAVAALTATGSAAPIVSGAAGSVAQSLPSDIAALLNQRAGVKYLGIFH